MKQGKPRSLIASALAAGLASIGLEEVMCYAPRKGPVPTVILTNGGCRPGAQRSVLGNYMNRSGQNYPRDSERERARRRGDLPHRAHQRHHEEALRINAAYYSGLKWRGVRIHVGNTEPETEKNPVFPY